MISVCALYCVRFSPLTLVLQVKFDCFNCSYNNTKNIDHHQILFNTPSSCKQFLRLLVYMNNCSEYTNNRHRNCVCVWCGWWWICGCVLSDVWTQSRVTLSFPMAVILDLEHHTYYKVVSKPLKIQWKWWSAIVYVKMTSVEDIIRPWYNKIKHNIYDWWK